mmetsp:Transcript_25565/g.56234  ORF Transcript_25565/g.56234 Transcript_25565/m.56234 type:complete len:336 (+) Transcript_25565:443-1450(+)
MTLHDLIMSVMAASSSTSLLCEITSLMKIEARWIFPWPFMASATFRACFMWSFMSFMITLSPAFCATLRPSPTPPSAIPPPKASPIMSSSASSCLFRSIILRSSIVMFASISASSSRALRAISRSSARSFSACFLAASADPFFFSAILLRASCSSFSLRARSSSSSKLLTGSGALFSPSLASRASSSTSQSSSSLSSQLSPIVVLCFCFLFWLRGFAIWIIEESRTESVSEKQSYTFCCPEWRRELRRRLQYEVAPVPAPVPVNEIRRENLESYHLVPFVAERGHRMQHFLGPLLLIKSNSTSLCRIEIESKSDQRRDRFSSLFDRLMIVIHDIS